MSEPVPGERRRGPDRRGILETAALLATESLDLREVNDAEARLLTRALRELELLRTPTAPEIQRQVAATHLRELHREIDMLNDRRNDALRRLADLLDQIDHASDH
jgi:hypothetical protein